MNHPNTEMNHSDQDSTSFVSRYFYILIYFVFYWLTALHILLQKIFLKEIEKVTKKRLLIKIQTREEVFIPKIVSSFSGSEEAEERDEKKVRLSRRFQGSLQSASRGKDCLTSPCLNNKIFKLKEERIKEKN